MRILFTILLLLVTFLSFSQDNENEQKALLAAKNANGYVYDGNQHVAQEDYPSAEMAYRKAISEKPDNVAGAYNLGNSYYKKGHYDEALFRQQQAAKHATTKSDKHRAYHNIGNILMKNKQCKEAVEAYKNALRNDPTDEETRYNLAIAKECAEQQKDDGQDDNKDKNEDQKDDNKDNQDKDNQDKDNQDQDNQDNKGDNKDEQKEQPKDNKPDESKDGEDKNQQQQPAQQPGQLSPQQIQNLLEAMNNQEQKTQEKINAEKARGEKLRTDKDW